MERSGISRLTQPPSTEGVDEAALALTKRARKRSRYLSPPYTDTDVQEKEAAGGGSPKQQQQQQEVLPDVSAEEVLSSLRAAALWDWEWQVPGQGADAAPLRFLSLYRNRDRSSIFFDNLPVPRATAGGGSHNDGCDKLVHKMPSLNAGSAMPSGDDRGLAKKKRREKRNPQSPCIAAVNGPMESAALLQQARFSPAHGHIWASQSAGFSANAVCGPVAPPMKRRKCRRRMESPAQHCFGNPVALVLDFAQGTPLPSKEDLISTFRRFGSVIDSETAIAHDKRSARVVFAARVQAEAAYSCADTLGTLGPPFVAPSLQDLPPITLNTPPPLPKLPLMDIRNNLEKMILSLTCSSSLFEATAAAANSTPEARPTSVNLVEEMKGLLAKVNKRLQGASATDHHRR